MTTNKIERELLEPTARGQKVYEEMKNSIYEHEPNAGELLSVLSNLLYYTCYGVMEQDASAAKDLMQDLAQGMEDSQRERQGRASQCHH